MNVSERHQGRMRVICALLSGVLGCLSVPKFGTGVIAWISLVPLLYALEGTGIRQAFTLGLIMGLVTHVGELYWITYAVSHYGNFPLAVGILAMVLLASYLSLYQAAFASAVVFFSRCGLSLMLAAPVLWTSLEYLQTHLFTGFPWELLGYSQYRWPVLIQVADITGVYGLSFLIVFINATIYEFITHQRHRWLHVSVAICALGVVVGYGLHRVSQVEAMMKKAPTMEVAIVQGNVDQSVKWDPAYQRETLGTHFRLTEQAISPATQLVVWPETAAPFFFQDRSPERAVMVNFVQRKKFWLIFGSPSYRRGEGDAVTLFNSVYLLSPMGEVKGRFDKVHLVPYGEYVPLRTIFPFMGKLVYGVGDFGTGRGYEPLLMEGWKIGALICYEAIFPAATRQYVKSGVDMLINVTNDAWFGCSSAPYQHLSMALFRAVEGRVALVRAANTGISAFIDPVGRIYKQTQLFEPAAMRGNVVLLKGKTVYGRIGDVFSWMCIILTVVGVITLGRRYAK